LIVQEPVGLRKRRLQIDRSGLFFAACQTNIQILACEIVKNQAALGPIFAFDDLSPAGSWSTFPGPLAGSRPASVVFAAIIGSLFFGEGFAARRVTAAVAVTIGVVLLALSAK
jgi:hypothetical protein